MEDGTELAEKTKGVFDVDDVLEVAVNVAGQFLLNTADIDVELNEITIESVILVVKKLLVALGLE